MDTLSIEEALRVITEKAAVTRFLSDSASYANHQAPDSAVLSGLGTMCADIEALTSRVKLALGGTALNTPLPSLSTAGVAGAAPPARQRRPDSQS
jgi:hypothetical protein